MKRIKNIVSVIAALVLGTSFVFADEAQSKQNLKEMSAEELIDLKGAIEKELFSRKPEAYSEIGSTGTGGGIIFYMEGNLVYECSPYLGDANWTDAKKMCEDYRGGGFSDWRMPTLEELSLIYENLRKPGKIGGNTRYWSATLNSFYGSNYYSSKDFEDGNTNSWESSNIFSVRAIRVYKK